MFSNMYKAYDAVPAALKEKLKGKKALHIYEYIRTKQAKSSGDISRSGDGSQDATCQHPVSSLPASSVIVDHAELFTRSAYFSAS